MIDRGNDPESPADTADDPVTERILERFAAARDARADWESLWQDCYDHALPHGKSFNGMSGGGSDKRRSDRLFDGTATDAVDQLAASLLSQLTPPWSRWFGYAPGPELAERDRDRIGPMLDRAAEIAQGHFDRSNFAIEAHQAFLDLVTVGTACLLLEEAPPGSASALRFTAVPLADVVLEEGPEGRLDGAFRQSRMTMAELRRRFPNATLPEERGPRDRRDRRDETRHAVLEAVCPTDGAYDWTVILDGGGQGGGAEATTLAAGRFSTSPYISFRWLKAPGEIYGRSPVMKALPDIKTANKVVELVLKNASIAVTGIWQADDDGVLNPAAIRLVPGAIIPKAVGSAGLSPLAAPGRFDVSDLMLSDLRARIRHALLVDKLAPPADARMTATEVLERSGEMARLLGATYGRLQAELLTPLILRATAILRRRGEIPDFDVDNRLVVLQHRSPLAQAQAQRDVATVLRWLDAAHALGPDGVSAVNGAAVARWMAEAFDVPSRLVVANPPPPAPPPPGGTPGGTP